MKEIILKLQDLEEIFQADSRFGYSQRSKMAGAQGTDAPNFEEYLKQHFPQFVEEYKSL